MDGHPTLVFIMKILIFLSYKTKGDAITPPPARVNQQPPMHQLAVLSTGCLAFFHSAPDGVHDSPFLLAADHCTFFLVLGRFSLDLTSHIATLLTFLPTLLT